jgi:hypothetical protein
MVRKPFIVYLCEDIDQQIERAECWVGRHVLRVRWHLHRLRKRLRGVDPDEIEF